MAPCRSSQWHLPDALCQARHLFGRPSIAPVWTLQAQALLPVVLPPTAPPAPRSLAFSATSLAAQSLPGWGWLGPLAGHPPGGAGLLWAPMLSRFPQAVGRLPQSACVSFHLPNESKQGQGRAPETPPAAAPLAFVSSPLHSSRYVLIP